MNHKIKYPIVPDPVEVFQQQRRLKNSNVSEETIKRWLESFTRVNEDYCATYMHINSCIQVTIYKCGDIVTQLEHKNLHYIYCYLIEVSGIINQPF